MCVSISSQKWIKLSVGTFIACIFGQKYTYFCSIYFYEPIYAISALSKMVIQQYQPGALILLIMDSNALVIIFLFEEPVFEFHKVASSKSPRFYDSL